MVYLDKIEINSRYFESDVLSQADKANFSEHTFYRIIDNQDVDM